MPSRPLPVIALSLLLRPPLDIEMGCGRKREESVDITVRKGKSKIYVAKSFRLSVIDWLHVAR